MQQHIMVHIIAHIEQESETLISGIRHIIVITRIFITERRCEALPDLRGARSDDMMSDNAILGRFYENNE